MDNSRHKESFFLGLDIGPILAAWSLGIVFIIWFVMIPCCRHYVCRSEDGDFPEEPPNACKCYCQDCGRKKSDNTDSTDCGCKKEELSPIRSKYVTIKCEHCTNEQQNTPLVCCPLLKVKNTSDAEGSANISDAEGSTNISDAEGPTNISDAEGPTNISDAEGSTNISDAEGSTNISDAEGPTNTSDAERSTNISDAEGPTNTSDANTSDDSTPENCCNKFDKECCDTNCLLRAGNVLVRMFYGGNLGPLRESQKLPIVDRRGREVAYINDVPIIERAFLLHLTLTLKSILLAVFCVSTFVDVLLVDFSTVCDFEKHCFFVNDDYSEDPLENCTLEVAKSNNTVSVICYEIVFDYKKAAGYAGGIYTISRLSVTITGNMSIMLHQYLKNKPCLFNISLFVQYVLSTGILCALIGLVHVRLYSWLKSPGPPIAQASIWLDSLCIILIVALSVATPWHLAVKPWDKDWTCCLWPRSCVKNFCKQFWCCLCRCYSQRRTRRHDPNGEGQSGERQSLTSGKQQRDYRSTESYTAQTDSPLEKELSSVTQQSNDSLG